MQLESKPQKKTFRMLAINTLVFLAAFLMLPLITAMAADTPPTIHVIDVIPHEEIQVSIQNLPADTDFAVTMSAAGGQGVGPVIANFNSNSGGTRNYWFEILTDVSQEDQVVVRIDSGTGFSASATFDNTTALSSAAGSAISNTTAESSTPAAPLSKMGPIHVLHVEQGGIVVAKVDEMPANTQFTVTVGTAGSQGFDGFKVGNLSSEDLATHIGTFEIPVELRDEPSLDLRIAAPGYLYLVTFSNTDF